jgi:hypothetical protein
VARRVSPETEAAVQKYGPRVRKLARKRYGISGKQLLRKLVVGESAVSSAGARGKTQFMPGTRAIAVKKYGVDPYRSTDEAVHGAVLHLKGKLTGRKGLEGYNPGDPNYPAYILGQKVKGRKGAAPPSRKGSTVSVPRTDTRYTTRTRKREDVEGAILDSLSSGASRKGGLLKDVSRRLDSGEYTSTVRTRVPVKAGKAKPQGEAPAKGRKPQGKVNIAEGANRPGVDLQPYARKFAERMARGMDVNIGTGSQHSQYTTSGKISDHWDGSAFDIPAQGPEGDKVAYRAFRAAGVPKDKARLWAKNGGLYNIETDDGRVQIIWKTREGGNHFNHVHVGIRPR